MKLRYQCISERAFQLLMLTSCVTLISGKKKRNVSYCSYVDPGYNRNVERGHTEKRRKEERQLDRKEEKRKGIWSEREEEGASKRGKRGGGSERASERNSVREGRGK